MTTGRLRRSAALTLTSVLAAALAVACGGSDPADEPTAGPTATATQPPPTVPAPTNGTPTGGPPAPPQPPEPPPPPPDDGFAWTPWGPASPLDPPPFQWYGALERRNCAGLWSALGDVEGRELWRALAAVCDAVIGGDQTQWTVAQRTARTVPAADNAGCLERAARALLARALEWHERNPGRQPKLRFPASGSKVACAFAIDEVHLVDADGQRLDGPLQGPVDGGTLLQIIGRGIDEPTDIRVGGRSVAVDKTVFVERGFVIRTPAADEAGTVRIRLRNRAGEVVAPVTFRYVEPSAQPS